MYVCIDASNCNVSFSDNIYEDFFKHLYVYFSIITRFVFIMINDQLLGYARALAFRVHA